MQGKMKALVFRGVNDMGVDEVDIPQIGPDEVLVRSKVSGICHSDLTLLSGICIVPFSYPVIPGHEWSGEVVEVGANVDSLRVGDRVTGECVTGCGKCSLCKSGNFTNCPVSDHFGNTEDGATAEYLKQRARKLHKLPEGFTWEDGALIEPFTIGLYALSSVGGTDASETVIIFGGGTIGLCTAAVARAMGAIVICVEPLKPRREMATRIGADHALDPAEPDLVTQVMDLTDGIGADIAVEASGSAGALQTIAKTVRNDGRVALTGINTDETIPAQFGLIQMKGLNVKGTVGSPYVWERAIKFIERAKPTLSPMVTHRIPLDQAVRAFEIAQDPERAIKVHIAIQ